MQNKSFFHILKTENAYNGFKDLKRRPLQNLICRNSCPIVSSNRQQKGINNHEIVLKYHNDKLIQNLFDSFIKNFNNESNMNQTKLNKKISKKNSLVKSDSLEIFSRNINKNIYNNSIVTQESQKLPLIQNKNIKDLIHWTQDYQKYGRGQQSTQQITLKRLRRKQTKKTKKLKNNLSLI